MYDSDFDTSDIGESEYTDSTDSLGDEDIELLEGVSDTKDDEALAEDIDDGRYHATRMSDEEVQRIDDMWEKDDYRDVEPYRATRIADIDEIPEDTDDTGGGDILSEETIEDQFAADVEAMSFDDLGKEQARLDELSQMDDMDIFAEYDERNASEYNQQLFDELTSGLSKEQLEYLKDGLSNGDKAVFEYFGLNSDDENDKPSLFIFILLPFPGDWGTPQKSSPETGCHRNLCDTSSLLAMV